jgi:uncharacterized protein involved in exopolysaccharide biosynthesis
MNNQSLIKTEPWIEVPAVQQTTTLSPGYSAGPQPGSAVDYWRILRRSKLSLLAFAALGLTAGLGVSFLQKPAYRATTAVEIQDNKEDLLATKMLNQSNESTPTDALTDVQTQMRILQSKTLLSRALDKVQTMSVEEGERKP